MTATAVASTTTILTAAVDSVLYPGCPSTATFPGDKAQLGSAGAPASRAADQTPPQDQHQQLPDSDQDVLADDHSHATNTFLRTLGQLEWAVEQTLDADLEVLDEDRHDATSVILRSVVQLVALLNVCFCASLTALQNGCEFF